MKAFYFILTSVILGALTLLFTLALYDFGHVDSHLSAVLGLIAMLGSMRILYYKNKKNKFGWMGFAIGIIFMALSVFSTLIIIFFIVWEKK